MAQYNFYQDERCAVWHRTYYSIEAPTWAEALVKAASIIKDDKPLDDDIRIEDSEFLDDTIEALPKERNPEEPTMEFFAETDYGTHMVADDVCSCRWRKCWGDTEFREMERITGFHQTDFTSEDGCHVFVEACDEWWNALPEAEKIEAWAEYVYKT